MNDKHLLCCFVWFIAASMGITSGNIIGFAWGVVCFLMWFGHSLRYEDLDKE